MGGPQNEEHHDLGFDPPDQSNKDGEPNNPDLMDPFDFTPHETPKGPERDSRPDTRFEGEATPEQSGEPKPKHNSPEQYGAKGKTLYDSPKEPGLGGTIYNTPEQPGEPESKYKMDMGENLGPQVARNAKEGVKDVAKGLKSKLSRKKSGSAAPEKPGGHR